MRTFIRIVGGLNQAACSLVGKSSMWYKKRVGVAIKISPAKPKAIIAHTQLLDNWSRRHKASERKLMIEHRVTYIL